MTDKKSGFVILHYGSMSPDAMSKASELIGEGAVIGFDAARMAGAGFAFGDPALLDDLKARLEPAARAEAQSAYGNLSPEAVAWISTGERGLSSDAMFSYILGTPLGSDSTDRIAYPLDPPDLRRCRLLCEAVPEVREGLPKMAEVSDIWARLVEEWDDLCALMDEETPLWRDCRGAAPRTYAKMKEVRLGQ
jgi:hypothetical protein